MRRPKVYGNMRMLVDSAAMQPIAHIACRQLADAVLDGLAVYDTPWPLDCIPRYWMT